MPAKVESDMEREFIHWLQGQELQFGQGVQIGVGDDAAVLATEVFGSEHVSGIVVSTDAITDGTHFKLSEHSLESIGRKAMAVNLSDLAAMAAIPVAAVISYTVPREFDLPKMKELFQGSLRLARQFGFSIVGGDTNCSDGPLCIAITVLGKPMAENVWRLDGGRAGDWVFVSGTIGGSIRGRHMNFEPRLELANYLASQFKIHAATDISDSLSLDLQSLASASNVGALINPECIPVSVDAISLAAQSGATPIEHALSDGEDFELIFTAPPEIGHLILNDEHLPVEVSRIGELIDPKGIWAKIDGQTVKLDVSGYSH